MAYISNREKINKLLDKVIVPYIKNTGDCDYYRLINEISKKLGCSEKMVKTILDSKINAGDIEERRVLTIPTAQVSSWLDAVIKTQNEVEEEVKEAITNEPK